MSPGRMVAALAAMLALATLAAALAAEETPGLAIVTFVLALLAALAIAAAVLAPVIIVRALQGEHRPWPPGRRLLAVALATGGLIVLPVYWHFDTEPGFSGPVGRCSGLVPLGELVQTGSPATSTPPCPTSRAATTEGTRRSPELSPEFGAI